MILLSSDFIKVVHSIIQKANYIFANVQNQISSTYFLDINFDYFLFYYKMLWNANLEMLNKRK